MNFDPTINLGHVIQAVAILGGGAAAYFRLSTKLALVSQELRFMWRAINCLPCKKGIRCEEEELH